MISDIFFMIPARISQVGVSEGVHSIPQDEHKPNSGQQHNNDSNDKNKHKNENKYKVSAGEGEERSISQRNSTDRHM